MSFYLIRLPLNSDASRLETALTAIQTTLQDSEESTGSCVEELNKQLGVEDYDHASFTLQSGHKGRLSSGAEVKRIVGTTRTARGGVSNSVDFVDVGLVVSVYPKFKDGQMEVELDVKKADLIVTESPEDDIPNSKIVTWDFDSTVQLKNEKAMAMGSTSGNTHWIFIVEAKFKPEN